MKYFERHVTRKIAAIEAKKSDFERKKMRKKKTIKKKQREKRLNPGAESRTPPCRRLTCKLLKTFKLLKLLKKKKREKHANEKHIFKKRHNTHRKHS